MTCCLFSLVQNPRSVDQRCLITSYTILKGCNLLTNQTCCLATSSKYMYHFWLFAMPNTLNSLFPYTILLYNISKALTHIILCIQYLWWLMIPVRKWSMNIIIHAAVSLQVGCIPCVAVTIHVARIISLYIYLV